MRTETYTPHPALQEFVSYIGIYSADFTASGALSNVYRFVPTYQRYIIFYLEDPIQVLKPENDDFITRSACVTIGPQEQPVTLNMGVKHLAVCIAFRPGGLFRLLNIPLSEMYEQDFDTSLLLGNEINEITERLKACANWKGMVTVIESYLLKKVPTLKSALPIDFAMEELIRQGGNISIDKIAAISCISVRQFERRCRERVGMPPKLYARLIRFGKAYRLKELNPQLTWTEIAYNSGYYDQMHFIRDFKEFAGMTPSFIHEEELMGTMRLHRLIV
ncbi:helix-turn-helix domain-containing protein [Chitinophaga sp. MM2321]|uniref:helix-turn-helix domain-containing protein n=1 Tax=Chitinophaga sp. MM2321 TaxID=3137178 RepID=UPI0032D59EF3